MKEQTYIVNRSGDKIKVTNEVEMMEELCLHLRPVLQSLASILPRLQSTAFILPQL